MTYRTGNTVVIQKELPKKCELCGKLDECRPAGPKQEQVCSTCAKKHPEALRAYMNTLFTVIPTKAGKA